MSANEIQGLTDEELESLKSATSEQQWNAACDRIKRARNGAYPSDWYGRVLAGGVLAAVRSKW